MAEILEFEIPQYLSNSSADEIHAGMLSQLPGNMDQTKGGIPWDLTYPNALAIAETVEFVIVEAIKSMFPMWATGIMLDYQGRNRGLSRKTAEYATGVVTVTGKVGHVLEAGTILSTTGINEEETILYETLEEATIGDGGTVEVGAKAVTIGTIGNVAAGRINRLDVPDENVISVVNAKAFSGGLDVESDDDYRVRLVEYDMAQGESFIGSVADYKRWAMSVNGVGGAKIVPANDTTGTVKIVLTDVDGMPASSELCAEVYNYIMQPMNESARLAPVNARLEVVTAEIVSIAIEARILLDGSRTLAMVKDDFVKRVNAYFVEEAIEERSIFYNRIGAILVETAGVLDYDGLRVNSDTKNIEIDSDKFPNTTLESVVLENAVYV